MGRNWNYLLGGAAVVAGACAAFLWSAQGTHFDLARPIATPVAATPATLGPATVVVPGSPHTDIQRTEDTRNRVQSAMFDALFTPAGEYHWDQPVYECRWLALGGEFFIAFGYDADGSPWATCDPDAENSELCGCIASFLLQSPSRVDLAEGRTEYLMPDTRFTIVDELRDQISKRLAD